MNEHEQLMREYEAGIVSACDPTIADVEIAWSDPALFCVLRNQSCAVITAWNPGSVQLSIDLNSQRHERLRMQLSRDGYDYWDSLNSAPDGSFAEPGFLIWAIEQKRALALAESFDQFAIYWYDTQGERVVLNCT